MSEETAAPVLQSPPPLCAALPQHSRPHPQQVSLLQCFALADLLNLTPAERNCLAVAAAAAAAPETARDAPTLDSPPSAVESALVRTVLERIRCGVVQKAASPSTNAKAATAAQGAVGGSSPPPAAVLSPRHVPARTLPSAVNAVPWTPHSSARGEPDTTATTSTSTAAACAPSSGASSLTVSSVPQSSSLSDVAALPFALCCASGTARVDALHPTFLPHLLAALLRGSAGAGGEQHTSDGGVAEGPSLPLSTSTSPRQSLAHSSEGSAPLAVPAERARCRTAFLLVFRLYIPLLLRRQREVLDAVESLRQSVSTHRSGGHDDSIDGNAAMRNEESPRDAFPPLLLQLPSTQQWLSATHLFLAAMVDHLSAETRRVDRCLSHHAQQQQQQQQQGTGRDSSERPRSSVATPLPVSAALLDTEAAEAVWMLTTIGTALSLYDAMQCGGEERTESATHERVTKSSRSDGEASRRSTASSGCGLEAMALARVIADTVGGYSSSPLAPPSAPAGTTAPPHAALLQQLFALYDTDGVPDDEGEGRSSAPSQVPPLQASSSPSPSSAECGNAPLSLADRSACRQRLREGIEALHTQHHRLLAAAERAVQRVLRLLQQQSVESWQQPAMLVAMCDVVAYQLRTQHWQRLQQLEEMRMETHAEGGDDTKLDDDTKSNGAPAATSLAEHPLQQVGPSTTHSFGDALWMDDETSQEQTASVQEDVQATEILIDDSNTHTATSTAVLAAVAPVAVAAHRPTPPDALSTVLPAPPLRLYTPRASSLSPACDPASSAGDPNSNATVTTVAALAAVRDELAAASSSLSTDPIARHCRAVHYYSPTRAMERLWELPPRVPRVWSTALSTVMACSALCVAPNSAAATTQLRLLVGGGSGGAGCGEGGGVPAVAVALPPASAASSMQPSPRPSLLDFGFARRRSEAAAEAVAGSPVQPSAPAAAASGTADAAVVGSLAQWHLRCLARQLRIAADGMADLGSGGGGGRGAVTRARSVGGGATAAASGVSAAASGSIPLVASSTHVPSSAGATGGASWFAAYTQANKAAVARAGSPPSTTSPAAAGALPLISSSSSSPASTPLERQHVSALTILASCSALQHLLRSHHAFFASAHVGGSTMRELRLAVTAARGIHCPTNCMNGSSQTSGGGGGGGVAGSVLAMLQCPPQSIASTASAAGAGAALPPFSRGRSLWGEVRRAGSGGDCSATALLDAALFEAMERECDVRGGHAGREGGVDGRQAAAVEGSGASIGAAHEAAKPAALAGGGGAAAAPVGASMCALTEAVLTAVACLGCSVVAVAQPSLEACADTTASQDSSSSSTSARPCAAHLRTCSQQQQKEQRWWCDALQALVALLLDAHRIHRSRRPTVPEKPRAAAVVTAAPLPASSLWRAGSPAPTAARGGSVEAPPSPSYAIAFLPSRPLPPLAAAVATASVTSSPALPASALLPLSIEAQVGVGALLVALVRALLQVRQVGIAKPNSSSSRTPSAGAASLVERVLAQCLFAVASVADDWLHDYAHPPPAALCDVLAMLAVMQVPDNTSPTATGLQRRPQHLWAALRATPFWDSALLGALESASLAWSTPHDAGKPHTAQAHKDTSNSTGDEAADELLRRLSCVPETPPPSAGMASPRESLLGYIPCSRDPCVTSWLPPSLRASTSAAAEAVEMRTDDALHESLLELMAEEETLILSKASVEEGETGVANSDGEKTGADEEWQLSVAVASSRRYAWWVSRLQGAWHEAALSAAPS